jgi:hypothetical protein
MCLYDITKVNNPTDDVVVGWKCFSKRNKGSLAGDIHGANITYDLDKWYQANNRLVYSDSGKEQYLTGFHTFPSRQSARNYAKAIGYLVVRKWYLVVRKVLIKQVRVEGQHDNWVQSNIEPRGYDRIRVPCLVADYMMIPKKQR